MQPLIDYSRAGEALIVSRFLAGNGPRFLVDIDAGDGITSSLSRGLIDQGWGARLIERNPKMFRELQQNSANLPGVELTTEISFVGLTEIRLLLVNDADTAVDVLRKLELDRFRLHVIVTKDSPAPQLRTDKYDLLSSSGYAYSGLAGEYSIWRLGSDPAVELESLSTSLPDFSSEGRGQAEFDPLPWELEAAATNGPREVMISGWAFIEHDEKIPPLVWIETSERNGADAQYVRAHRYWRPEIANRFKRRHLGMSGFRGIVPVSGRQRNSARLRVVQADGQRLFRSDAELLPKSVEQKYEQVAREGLARKFLSGSGIEIGALQRPLSISKGCQVRYVDRIPVDQLRTHYTELAEFPLQAPDLLDDGEKLTRVATRSQDFVIANHFFEHSENPIQTLKNLLRVLKVGGILYMAVPDKHYTFDFRRPVTRYETLQRTYEMQLRPDRCELVQEWVTLSEGFTGVAAAQRAAQLIATNYSIHYNVWTFDDLLVFLLRARSDFELPFQVTSAVCCDNEAIMLLERT